MKTELRNSQNAVFIHVEYWPNKQILYANWIGSDLTVDQVKQGASLVLEKIKEFKVASLLNDNRELSGIWDGANEWIANEWMPKAIDSGLKKFAHILPQDLYATLSAEFMEDNSKKLEDVFQMKLFNSQEEAEHWLLNTN